MKVDRKLPRVTVLVVSGSRLEAMSKIYFLDFKWMKKGLYIYIMGSILSYWTSCLSGPSLIYQESVKSWMAMEREVDISKLFFFHYDP